MWTIDQVRQYLPDVKLQVGDSIVVASLQAGRDPGRARVMAPHLEIAVEWVSVVEALNRDLPLVAGPRPIPKHLVGFVK